MLNYQRVGLPGRVMEFKFHISHRGLVVSVVVGAEACGYRLHSASLGEGG